MDVPELLSHMDSKQSEHLDVILKSYSLNPLEEKIIPYFKGICDLFQYPNVCLLVKWLQDDSRKQKAANLIEGIIQKI